MYNPQGLLEGKSMRRSHFFFSLISIATAALACSQSDASPTADEWNVETRVAATLTSSVPARPTDVPTEAISPSEATPTATSDVPPAIPTSTPALLRIVYTNAGNVWLIEDTQPPVQLTHTGDAVQVLISSDGMKIVFIRQIAPDTPSEIRSINIDGSGELLLMAPADFNALYTHAMFLYNDFASIDFVPGTHSLMLNTRTIAEGPGLLKFNDLLLLDSDTGVMMTLFPAEMGGDFMLSPDGTRAALTLPTTIGLVNSDGSNHVPNILSYDPVITYSEFQYYAQPVWKPDSSAFGIAIPSADPLSPASSGTIWQIPSDGSTAMEFGTILGDFYFPQVFGAPLLSNNLNRLAFLRETATPNVYDLYLANADGSAQVIYANGDIQWKGWAPDGIHFVYSFGGPSNLQLGVDGGLPSPLGSCINLHWFDETRFLCLSGSMGSWTLMQGGISIGLSPIVSPSGDFVSFDTAY
jgi:hypothetical protein